MAFKHFITVYSMPGLIPMLQRSNIQTGEAEIGGYQGQAQVNDAYKIFFNKSKDARFDVSINGEIKETDFTPTDGRHVAHQGGRMVMVNSLVL